MVAWLWIHSKEEKRLYLTDAAELFVHSWNFLVNHLVGEGWAVWLWKLTCEKWQRELERLAFQQAATACHLYFSVWDDYNTKYVMESSGLTGVQVSLV